MQKIDMMFATETHVREEQRIFLLGYTSYHDGHPSGNSRGSTTVLVRSALNHCPKPPILAYNMQTASVQLQTTEGSVWQQESQHFPPPTRR